MNLQLTDKTALVSGSSKGIGFAIACQLAAGLVYAHIFGSNYAQICTLCVT